jgi:hypothetical protein
MAIHGSTESRSLAMSPRIERRRSSCPGGTTPELTRRGSKAVNVPCIMPSAMMNSGTHSNKRALMPKWASSGSFPSSGRKKPFFQAQAATGSHARSDQNRARRGNAKTLFWNQSDLALKTEQQVATDQRDGPWPVISIKGGIAHWRILAVSFGSACLSR